MVAVIGLLVYNVVLCYSCCSVSVVFFLVVCYCILFIIGLLVVVVVLLVVRFFLCVVFLTIISHQYTLITIQILLLEMDPMVCENTIPNSKSHESPKQYKSTKIRKLSHIEWGSGPSRPITFHRNLNLTPSPSMLRYPLP